MDTDGKGCKPWMILDYNATKGAVDAFDQCISYYNCSRQTRRWPMRLFFFLIDAACYNAYVMWKITSTKPNKRVDRRRLFLTTAGEQLICPLIERRANLPTISHQPSVYRAMLSVGAQPVFCEPETQKSRKRGRCLSCPRKKTSRLKTDAVNASNLFARNTRQKNSYVRDAC